MTLHSTEFPYDITLPCTVHYDGPSDTFTIHLPIGNQNISFDMQELPSWQEKELIERALIKHTEKLLSTPHD